MIKNTFYGIIGLIIVLLFSLQKGWFELTPKGVTTMESGASYGKEKAVTFLVSVLSQKQCLKNANAESSSSQNIHNEKSDNDNTHIQYPRKLTPHKNTRIKKRNHRSP